eukprot:jgi/Orpsp1_1/1181957/evm.model.c7180000079257.1
MKLLLLIVFILFISFNFVLATENDEEIYCGTWSSSQYCKSPKPSLGLKDNSMRQIVRISIGGEKFRFHFSNIYGEKKLAIDEVHVARSAFQGSGRIYTDSDTVITFNGNRYVMIPANGTVVSDDIKFSAPALSELAISIFFGERIPDNLTGHDGSRTTSFMEMGNTLSKEKFYSSYTFQNWFTISAIDVLTPKTDSKAIVCFGDSITDGRGTSIDKQNRWTDILATRLQNNEATKNIAVLNQGIGATTIIGTKTIDIQSPAGENRFQRDVLDQTNVKYLIILYGVNDILFSNASSDAIIGAYKRLIILAHENGITVYGGTILPFGKNSYYTSEKEDVRNTVNQWIKNTSAKDGGFDGYIDFSKEMEDPSNSLYLNQQWNFENDGLHPNYLGYEAMGNA